MDLAQRFGEVRSLLDQPPSAMRFDLICQHLTLATHEDPEPVTAVWLPYIEARLDAWPDATRLCPKHLLPTFEQGHTLWGHLVRALDYQGERLSQRRMDSLLALPHAAQITSLDLRSAHVKDAQLAALVQNAPFRLAHFAFRHIADLRPDTLTALFQSPMLQELRSLSFLGWSKMTTVAFTLMLEHLPLERLHTLDLSGCDLSAKRLSMLLDSGKVDGLKTLRLAPWVSERSIYGHLDLIARHPALSSLETLHLKDTNTKDFKHLTTATHLLSLRSLRFDGDALPPAHLATLAALPLDAIEEFALQIGAEAQQRSLDALAQLPWLTRLHSLSLVIPDPRDGRPPALTPLLDAPHFPPQLRRLDLTITALSQLEELARAPQLSHLTELHLSLRIFDADPEPEALEAALTPLYTSPHLGALHTLGLWTSSSSSPLPLEPLRNSPLWSRLRRLRLNDDYQPAELEPLFAHSASLLALEQLSLRCPFLYYAPEVLSAMATRLRAPHLQSVELPSIDDVVMLRETLDASPQRALPSPLHLTHPEDTLVQSRDWF